MAIVVSSPSRTAGALINYVLNEKVGQAPGTRYVAASGFGGCIPKRARQQFTDTRQRFNKEVGYVQAYHVIESFGLNELDPKDPDDQERAHALGIALARDGFPGRMFLVVTQIDGKTGCLHNHIVINSLDTRTGRSLDSSIVMHSKLARDHDRVLDAEGFEQTVALRNHSENNITAAERKIAADRLLWEANKEQAVAAGKAFTDAEPVSWEADLKWRITQGIESSDVHCVDDFTVVMREQYRVDVRQRGEKGRGLSYAPLDDDGVPVRGRKRRASTLGTNFTMDALDEAIELRRQQPVAAVPVAQPVSLIPPLDLADARLEAERRQDALIARIATVATQRPSESHTEAAVQVVEPTFAEKVALLKSGPWKPPVPAVQTEPVAAVPDPVVTPMKPPTPRNPPIPSVETELVAAVPDPVATPMKPPAPRKPVVKPAPLTPYERAVRIRALEQSMTMEELEADRDDDYSL